jgi:Asp-tRNA(Asn)/Glu-tRNA(Gln) amidotransferase A subunit family amidase
MDATISQLQEEMAAGHVSSAELTQMYIDRIKAYDERLKLNSIISINPNALQDARALDRERSKGKVRGPLHGIPIVVKANYDVTGMATSAGSIALADMMAQKDAFVVKKLRDAGAVILAQANMSEFAYSAVDSRSTLGGFVHNAYDGSKTPAGSSGGTAVAVTCNFAAAGLGTDTGGSIRNPSSFSNLYGIRPSKGLTSISGVVPLCAQRDTTGPMARTAEDMALLLQTMAGTDPADDFTQEADADALLGKGYVDSLSPGALKGMRIGYFDASFVNYTYTEDDERDEAIMPDKKLTAMLNRTRANLRKAGASFVDLSEELPVKLIWEMADGAMEDDFEYSMNKYLRDKGENAPFHTLKELMLSGRDISYSNLDYDVEELADSFEETESPYTESFGGYLRGKSWAQTLEAREKINELLKEKNIDAVMYLNYFNAVPDQNTESWDLNSAGFCYIFGPTMGLPEMVLPMGFSDTDSENPSELPMGLYLFSSFGNEKTLMEIAYAYEQQAGPLLRRMPQRTPALRDKKLNTFLEDLMERAYSIAYSKYNEKPVGKVQLMLNACDRAKNVDLKNPAAVYEAAETLAKAYDKVMASLEASGLAPEAVAGGVTVGQKFSAGKLKYEVVSIKKGKLKVAVTGMKNKKDSSVTIPATVKYNDATYRVSAIDAKAFYGRSKLKSVSIGKNVVDIGSSAFQRCKRLKAITVKSKVLSSVGTKALKGIHKKAVIKVPSTKKKAYQKLLKNKGQAKSVKIK